MSESTSQDSAPVWFVTGCSTGFGREFVHQLLAGGYRVVATARRAGDLAEFAAHPAACVLALDVTDAAQIAAAVAAAERRFGRIDVLVNNAGIGYFAAVEEGEEAAIRRLFDINVFGLAAMTRAVLPTMRRQKRGCIVNLSSIAGLRGAPSLGYYNASKFAVEGLSEALWQEVEPLGIKVMLVEPSGFRTDWAGRSAAESAARIDAYAATAGQRRDKVRGNSGKQAGDPARLVRSVIEAVASGQPPHRMPLGNVAIDGAFEKIEELRAQMLAGETRARAADGPAGG